jgi:hypothetical protein
MGNWVFPYPLLPTFDMNGLVVVAIIYYVGPLD